MIEIIPLVAKLLAGPVFDYLKSADQNKITRETVQEEIQKELIANAAQIAQYQHEPSFHIFWF